MLGALKRMKSKKFLLTPGLNSEFSECSEGPLYMLISIYKQISVIKNNYCYVLVPEVFSDSLVLLFRVCALSSIASASLGTPGT